MNSITTSNPVFSKDQGTLDLWWPYGPAVGRYTFKTDAEQSRGDLIQMLIRDSRGAATPMHVHHGTDETFYVVEGEMTVYIGDERHDVKAGDYVFGPRGVPHSWIATSETIEMLVTFGPAGQEGDNGTGIKGFFSEVGTEVGEGEKPAPAMPDTELFATRMMHYGIELVGPPPTL